MAQIGLTVVFFIAQLLTMSAFVVSFFLIGFAMVHLLFPKQSWYISALLSMGVGLSLVIALLDFSIHFFGHQGYLMLIVVILLSVLITVRHKQLLQTLWSECLESCRGYTGLIVMTLIMSLSMWLGIALSGSMRSEGMLFQPGIMRDSLWHLALIKSLLTSNPPVHPSDSSLLLTNYHYFYDLFLAGWHRVTGQSIIPLYFTLASLFTTLILAFSSLVVMRLLVKKHLSLFGSILMVFLFWGGSLAFLLPLFLPDQPWGESSFWVSQTFVMLVNPQLLLSFAMLNCLLVMGLIGIKLNFSSKQIMWWLLLLFLLMYVIAGLKFFGVIFGLLITTYVIVRYIIHHNYKLLLSGAILIFLIVSISSIAFRFVDLSSKQMLFSPLWFVTSMIASPDRVYVRDWTLREEHYKAVGSWYYLVALKSLETGIFYLGNLGLRFIGLFFVVPLIIEQRRKKGVLQNKSVLFVLLGLVIVSSSIPLLFIQNGVVWNSIQFWYYTLFFMDFLAAITLGYVVLMVPSRWMKMGILVIVLGLSSIMFFVHLSHQLRHAEYISPIELHIARLFNSQDTLLVCPEGKDAQLYFETSFFSFFSDARVILIDPLMLEVIGKGAGIRIAELKNDILFSSSESIVAHYSQPQITAIICDNQQLSHKSNTIGQLTINNTSMTVVKIQPLCPAIDQCQSL